MRNFTRVIKWTVLLIMGALLLSGAIKSKGVNFFLSKVFILILTRHLFPTNKNFYFFCFRFLLNSQKMLFFKKKLI